MHTIWRYGRNNERWRTCQFGRNNSWCKQRHYQLIWFNDCAECQPGRYRANGSTAGPGQILIGNGSGYSPSQLNPVPASPLLTPPAVLPLAWTALSAPRLATAAPVLVAALAGSRLRRHDCDVYWRGLYSGNSLPSQSGSTVSVLGNLSASGSFTATSGTFSGAVSAGRRAQRALLQQPAPTFRQCHGRLYR